MKKSIIVGVIILLIIAGVAIKREYFITLLIKNLGKPIERSATLYIITVEGEPSTADEKCAGNLPKTCIFTGVTKKEIDSSGLWDDQHYDIRCSYKCLCVELSIIGLDPIGEYCNP